MEKHTEYSTENEMMRVRHAITLDPDNQYYFSHNHSQYELIYFLSGDASHVVEDRKYKLKPGDLVIISPLRYHFIQHDGIAMYDRINILFDSELPGMEHIKRLAEKYDVISIPKGSMTEALFAKFDFYKSRLENDEFLQASHVLLQELSFDLSLIDSISENKYSIINPILSRATEYINRNLFTFSGVTEVAEKLFITESYLFRLFRQELKMTPKRYINDKRMLIAQKMLQTGQRATAVAEACGFTSYATFYRAYVKFLGKPPSNRCK